MSKPTMISTNEVAKRAGVPFNDAKRLLAEAGVQPAMTVPMGKRPPSVFWNVADIQPLVDKVMLERIQRRQGAVAPAPTSNPIVVQPAPATDGTALEFVKGEIEILRNQGDAIAAGQAVVGTDLAQIKNKLADLDAVMRQILDAITSPEPK